MPDSQPNALVTDPPPGDAPTKEQVSIRLDAKTLARIDEIVVEINASIPAHIAPHVRFTRTDVVRVLLDRGIVAYHATEPPARPSGPPPPLPRCPETVDGGRCAGLVGHDGEHYRNARERGGRRRGK